MYSAGIPTLKMNIKSNLTAVKQTIPNNVRLVAVSKYHPVEAIQEAYDAGQRTFGESKALDMRDKYEALPKDIQWHFIGHLQSNKIKYIVPYVSLIESVDSFKLLNEIEKCAAKNNRIADCLLQLHVAQEETKFGFTFDECRDMLSNGAWQQLTHVNIRGLMTMASNTDNKKQIQSEFHSEKLFFDEIKEKYFNSKEDFNILSEGMSHDYPIAIGEGSNCVRIGTAIFGKP